MRVFERERECVREIIRERERERERERGRGHEKTESDCVFIQYRASVLMN